MAKQSTILMVVNPRWATTASGGRHSNMHPYVDNQRKITLQDGSKMEPMAAGYQFPVFEVSFAAIARSSAARFKSPLLWRARASCWWAGR